MNANDLAQYLRDFMYSELDYDEDKHNEAQLLLRQLQAENEALKAYKEAYKILWDERNERK